jgi:hypothetical protein
MDNYEMYYSHKEEENGEGLIVWNLDWRGLHFEEPQIIDRCPGGKYHEQTIEYVAPRQELMLYTNKRDINDNRIYEGDIFKYTHTLPESTKYTYTDNQKLFSGVDVVERFGSDFIGMHRGILLSLFVDVKVIGNIYEDEELLDEVGSGTDYNPKRRDNNE